MEIIYTRKELAESIDSLNAKGYSTGFVPTMGALHAGHLSLIHRAAEENDTVTCSIFVNPLQFNRSSDLESYPRQVEMDLDMLREAGCGLVFLPSAEEMYPQQVKKIFDLGVLDQVMEGSFRPGHFNGVAIVVERLFNLMSPDRAYFGEKDYQQLMVIREMVRQTGLKVEIIPCPIIREEDGLAMSSRNLRLSKEQRVHASFLHSLLLLVSKEFGQRDTEELADWAFEMLRIHPWFEPEYFDIRDPYSLEPIKGRANNLNARAFVVACMGDVRLIDNMALSS